MGGNLYIENVGFFIYEHELTFNDYAVSSFMFEKCYFSFARFIPSTLYIFVYIMVKGNLLNIIFSLLLQYII